MISEESLSNGDVMLSLDSFKVDCSLGESFAGTFSGEVFKHFGRGGTTGLVFFFFSSSSSAVMTYWFLVVFTKGSGGWELASEGEAEGMDAVGSREFEVKLCE